MSGQEPPAQSSTWSKTRSGFSTVGKGAGAARSGINSGLSKLDSMSISSKGVSFKKEMSGQNVSYDRDNHVSRPKVDVSHLPPPPRRVPGQVPSPARTASPAARAVPRPIPTPSTRVVPPPPPARRDDPLPTYTPVAAAAAVPPPPVARSSIPSMAETKTAFASAKTVGGLYNKYGTNKPGGNATPSWSEVKAGASAAQNLHSMHQRYAPNDANAAKPTTTTTTTTTIQTPVASRPVVQNSVAARPPPPVQSPVAVKPVVAKKPPVVAPKPRADAVMPSPSPSPVPLPPRPAAPKEYCIGVYSFDAQADGDLSFNVGDKIEVIERTDDVDAWWRGRLHGREGVFPGNYTRLESSR